MAWRLLLLLLFISPLFGDVEDSDFFAFDSAEPSALHLGLVNAIMGSYVESDTDIRVRSVAPLAMQRRFSSADASRNRYANGWWIHELKADWSNGGANHKGRPHHDKCTISLSHPEYGRLHYLPVKDPDLGWRVQRFRSICNTGSGEISGRTNLRTARVGFAGHPCFDLVRGDGEIARYYFNAGGENDFYKKESISGHLCSRALPSGYFLDYFCGEVKAYNCSIKEKQQLLGSLAYREVEGGVEVTSSDGQRAKLAIDGDRHLRRVEVDGRPWVEYDYLEESNQPVGGKSYLCMRRGPGDRFLEIRYYFNSMLGFGEKWTRPLPDGSFGPDPALGRVSSLWAPIGRDGSSAMVARFDYTFHFFSSVGVDFNGGVTTVYDNDGKNGDGNRTVYHYDVGLRPTEIVHEEKVGDRVYQPLSRVCYQYSQEVATEGDLVARVVYEGKEPIAATTFEYDDRGNLLCQRVYGNLTGGCSTPIQLQNGLHPIENGVESYAIWQGVPEQQGFYSTPHSNLVVERREGERVTLTRYWEGSDLIAAQFVKADGRIQERLFNRYDANHVLIERIEDDGSGMEADDLTDVHVRTICRIRPVASGSAIGFPERVEKWYWDGTRERLLSAVEHRYSDRNLPIEADTYDANGEYRTTLYNEYDLGGRLVRQIDAMGFEHRFEYDIHGNLTAELDSRSASRHFYDLANRRIRTDRADQSTHYRYDLNSRCVEEEEWLGRVTERSYDALGRVKEERRLDQVHSYEYNSQGGVTCETDPRGFKTFRKFNARNQPIQVDYPDGTSESFRYDLAGREVFRRRRDGVSVRSSYDGMGHLIRIEEGEKVSTFVYCGDRIVSSCDPTGLVRTYGYDGAGRLISERWGDCRRAYSYDAMGRRCETRDWYGLGEEEYCSSIELYDDLNRLIEEIEQESDGKIYRRTTREYDPSGNEIGVTTYGEDGVPERTTTEYDQLDRPIRIVDPLGHVTIIEYLNQEVRTTDPLGHITIERKDPFDRTISVEELDRMGQRISFVSMSYDPAGNCIEERHALLSPSKNGELTTRREFDSMGRLTLLIEPDGKQTSFVFNDLGQLILRIDPDGRETEFRYDDFNRLLLESSENLTYSYEYDLGDRLVGSTGTKLIYNEVGHLVCEEQASGLSIRYECDLLGRRTKVILPDGSEIGYTYDGFNLRGVSRGAYTHGYLEFDLSGRSLLERNIGGEEIRRRWDEAGRLIELDSPTYVASLDYDGVGNLTHLSGRDGEGKFSQCYSYDALYQIASEKGHNYTYDSLNNRTDCDGELCEYDEGNQLIRFGSIEFSYDDLGNLRSRSNSPERYLFDDRNRLIEVTNDGTVYRYSYDSFDRRISKSWETAWSEGSVTYLYDGMNEIAQVDSTGSIEQLRILGRGVAGDIGAIVALELFGETITPVTNHRGDLVGLISSYGDTFENYRYSAFGVEEVTDSTGRSIESINPWRFSSKRVDEETGLIYFGRRYYSPELGRWISRDPEADGDGPNLYAYVKNRPHALLDPRGTEGNPLFGSPLFGSPTTSRLFGSPLAMIRGGFDSFTSIPINRPTDYLARYVGNRLFNPLRPATLDLGWEGRMGSGRSQILYPDGGFSIAADHKYTVLMNGINTSLSEFKQMLGYHSELCRRGVIGVWNATHGIAKDLLECGVNLVGKRATPPALKFVECCLTVMQNDPLALIHCYCHSQAAIHVSNGLTLLPEWVRKRIIVTAIAPACQIDDRLCRNVRSFISMRDFIPFFDFGGTVRNFRHCTFLRPSPGAPYFDHTYFSSTYRKEIIARDRFFQRERL